MRDSSYNTQRPAPANLTSTAEHNSVADLNNQLYRAYLSGDGAAVERIMSLIHGADGAEPARAPAA